MDNKPPCDHRGKWANGGITPIKTPTSMVFFHNMFCTECGFADVKVVTVNEKKPTITTPEPGIVIPK